ncbi:unnamed protein product [Cuscuta campestris]|uniref:adenylate dimethylallyltransferase (ADP/ATP-dependent) n=1 Tax=Cuscuta campestris TaxID=132261 RepID=A0A484NP86_9ASTE|nr:unnamed protein product [Cuscuta campestris]
MMMSSIRSAVSTLMPKQKLPNSFQYYLHSSGGFNLGILHPPHHPHKDKLLVVLGTTGAGKSRLSIDLASRFSGEIINSDKMQVYRGLDVLTNKVTEDERRHVPHHLLGVVGPKKNFTAKTFCFAATETIKSITARGHLPIIAGGSNSFIEALMDDKDCRLRSTYDVCFLWVDVSMPVLHSFVSDRVDKMVDRGLVEEARSAFDPKNGDYSTGIRKSIGVPEFHRYFQAEPTADADTRAALLNEAIDEVKVNTCVLSSQQLEKIKRLRDVRGWKLHRVDATEVSRMKAAGGGKDKKMWENQVVAPSATIVTRFLHNRLRSPIYADAGIPIKPVAGVMGLTAAIH